MTGANRGLRRRAWLLSALASTCLATACAPTPLAPLPQAAPGGARIDEALLSDAPAPKASTAPDATMALQGQMGIKLGAWQDEPAKGMSFGFFFQGQVERGSLALMTPLGSQVAQIDWTPTAATLRRIGPGGGEDLRRGGIEELAEAALGEALPLQTLVHWMQGRPDPALPHTPQTEAGLFEQRGWLIDTRERAQGRILATRHGRPGLRDARISVRLDP